jgi:hypothetical protein
MIPLRKKLALGLAATAAVGATIAIGLGGGSSPASADPKQYTDPIFTFGSDTVQDIENRFAGFNNNINYTPLQSSAASGRKQIVSWDAFPAGTDPATVSCITTKVGFGQITRPNGSGAGEKAISSAFNAGQLYPAAANVCGNPKSYSGLVGATRSSSGPTNPNTTGTGKLTFIPFGRDAIYWAYSKPSGGGTTPIVTDLTAAQITAIHGTGPQLIGTTVVASCGIQNNSGTYKTYMKQLGLGTGSNAIVDPGSSFCNLLDNTRLQENNGTDFAAKSALLAAASDASCDGVAGGAAVSCANVELIVGFSASQWIARSNNLGTPNPTTALGATGGLGSVAGQAAIQGTAPNLTAVAAAYNSTTFGRDVYHILAKETISGVDADPALVDMFVGPTSVVCSQSTAIQAQGFLTLGASCGSTTLEGNFVAS